MKAAREERSNKTAELLQSVFDFCDGDSSGLISSAETVMAMAYFFNRPLAFEEVRILRGLRQFCSSNFMRLTSLIAEVQDRSILLFVSWKRDVL